MQIKDSDNYKPIYGEASGNTFLIFDCLDRYDHDFNEDIIRSHHKSRGTDRIDSCLVLTKVKESPSTTDFGGLERDLLMNMYVYEPGDGFCGNGARTVSKYCFHRLRHLYDKFFISCEGLHELLQQDADYLVEMGESIYEDPTEKFIKKGILDDEGKFEFDDVTWYYVNTSEPHLVTFEKITDEKLVAIGNKLNRDSNSYPIGINLNRVSIIDESTIRALTFERGINRLTKSCGSGSTSCVALSKRLKHIDPAANKVTVEVKGGYVIVSNENNKVYLSGPCYVEGVDEVL